MKLSSETFEQIAFNTRPRIEEHLLIIMDKSKHEVHLFQPLQINKKQFKVVITFSTGYNGIFNVTDRNIKFYFTKLVNDDDFSKITISPGAYEIKSLNNEIKRIIFEEGLFTEANYPIHIKPNFSTLGSNLEVFQSWTTN